jgi:hypothetical protein
MTLACCFILGCFTGTWGSGMSFLNICDGVRLLLLGGGGGWRVQGGGTLLYLLRKCLASENWWKFGGIITWWLWRSMSSSFACLSCITHLAEIIWDWISTQEKYSLGFKGIDCILFIGSSFPQFSNNSPQLHLYHTCMLIVIYPMVNVLLYKCFNRT